MKMRMIKKNKKFFFILISISILINISLSLYSLKKFDHIRLNYEGKYYNQLLYADLNRTWKTADDFKKKLDNGINFLIIQILFFYFTIILLSKELFDKFEELKAKIIILFLCLEPCLLQWHSSFWSESIFFSFMILIFTLLLKNSNNFLSNLIIGLISGLMFMQRSVSFLYIIPITLFYFFVYKKNFKPLLFLLIGYFSVMSFVGYNNFKKTDSLYFIPTAMTYYGYYHYFAPTILADRKKITSSEASQILLNDEKKWITTNDINLDKTKDKIKNIKYRNKIFLNEVFQNPVFSAKFFLRRVIKMTILMPFWVNNQYYFDKTDPSAKNNPKKYFNKNFFYNIPYTLILHLFSLTGVIVILMRIYIRGSFEFLDKFYLFNLISICYFLFISGLWGNFKYFAPCLISLSFYFTEGLIFFKKFFYDKK